jgi:site-specific recombinase XerD
MRENGSTQSELTLSQTQPLELNAAAVYLASLPAETGRRTQAQALRVIAQVLGVDFDRLNWGALRYQHTAVIRATLAQRYAPATANKILSALRQTLKQAWILGQMTAADYSRAIALEPVRGQTVPTGRELSPDEILALLTTCQKDKNQSSGTRDAAIIAILYAAGLRRDEVVKLRVENYEPETGRLVFTGQRDKQRSAYVTNGAADALNDWLKIRGTAAGALFVEISKSGKVLTEQESKVVKPARTVNGMQVPNKKAGRTIYRGGALTAQAIYNMLLKRAQEAGIENFSPHDLRRTFITHLLAAGADIATVSKMAGHANVQTTARYDRSPEEAKRKAAELLHVPYTPKLRSIDE